MFGKRNNRFSGKRKSNLKFINKQIGFLKNFSLEFMGPSKQQLHTVV